MGQLKYIVPIFFYNTGHPVVLKIIIRRNKTMDNKLEETTAQGMQESKSELKPVITNYIAPKRNTIHKELKRVSKFKDDELGVLNWSSLYKAHSLIVKYGQTGVEEIFRKEKWFQDALEDYKVNPKKYKLTADEEDNDEEKDKNVKLTKDEKKALREKERQERIAEKEKRRQEKKSNREKKTRVKKISESFKGIEFKIHEFYGFIKEISRPTAERNYDIKLIDDTLIEISKNNKNYMNIFVKDGRITFKRGVL